MSIIKKSLKSPFESVWEKSFVAEALPFICSIFETIHPIETEKTPPLDPEYSGLLLRPRRKR